VRDDLHSLLVDRIAQLRAILTEHSTDTNLINFMPHAHRISHHSHKSSASQQHVGLHGSAQRARVSAIASRDHYALQAVDYFLWALQRRYTNGEDRYLRFLWDMEMDSKQSGSRL